ncbi:hypothetical protein V8C44DRAFT_337106 [Trichoderma aethiopicum]
MLCSAPTGSSIPDFVQSRICSTRHTVGSIICPLSPFRSTSMPATQFSHESFFQARRVLRFVPGRAGVSICRRGYSGNSRLQLLLQDEWAIIVRVDSVSPFGGKFAHIGAAPSAPTYFSLLRDSFGQCVRSTSSAMSALSLCVKILVA